MNLQKKKNIWAHLPWCSKQLILNINVKNNVMMSIEINVSHFGIFITMQKILGYTKYQHTTSSATSCIHSKSILQCANGCLVRRQAHCTGKEKKADHEIQTQIDFAHCVILMFTSGLRKTLVKPTKYPRRDVVYKCLFFLIFWASPLEITRMIGQFCP